MATSRRLHFVVGTGLLGASLSLGCTPKPKPDTDRHLNPRGQPQPEEPEDHVNVGPVDEPEQPEQAPDKPDDVHVNPGPQEPEVEEPKTVNTRPPNN